MFLIGHIGAKERKRNKRNGICPYRDAIACDYTKLTNLTNIADIPDNEPGIPQLNSHQPREENATHHAMPD